MLIECQGTFYRGLLVLILLCKSKEQILRAAMAILRQDDLRDLDSKMYHLIYFVIYQSKVSSPLRREKVFKNCIVSSVLCRSYLSNAN